MSKKKINAVSLFANVGVAECYFKNIGIDVKVANEIDSTRVKFYKHLYPDVNMIEGDITDENIINQIIRECKKNNVELLLATPPCQGMSLAGKMDPQDQRNQLIFYAIKVIKAIKPKYIFLENVPQLLKTQIKVDGKTLLIPEYIHQQLDADYYFAKQSIVCAKDYDVPQMRKRNIFILSRKDMQYKWEMPLP